MSVVKRQQIFEVINTLPDDLIIELAEFIDYLQYKSAKESKNEKNDSIEEFDRLADQLVDEYEKIAGDIPPLSDYAVSRAGIYEDHA